jgi:hypothetical protein
MALDPNAEALFVDKLAETLPDMTWGTRYGVLFGLVSKQEENGKAVAQSIDVDLGPGGSATYEDAYDAAALTKRVQFLIPFFTEYGIASIPGTDNNLSKGPASAANLLLDESQKAINIAKGAADVDMFSDGYGTIATIVTPTNTSGSTWTVTFRMQSEILRFRPNMRITQKDTPSGTLAVGYGVVTNVNQGLKRITLTAVSGFTPTTGYVVGVRGSQATGTTFTTVPGLPAWIPPAASRPVSNTAFLNVDRSENEQKLAGSYYDGTADTILDGVLKTEAQIANVPGANPDTVVLSTANKARVLADCQTQKRYVETRDVKGADIDVYFRVVSIQGVTGMLNLVESSNCPDDQIWVLDSSDMCLGAPNKTPIKGVNNNGSPVIDDPAHDRTLVRFRFQAAFWPRTPGNHGCLTVRAN